MATNRYEVYDNNNRLLGTFCEIADAVIFVKAHFFEYYKEEYSLTIKQVDNAIRGANEQKSTKN